MALKALSKIPQQHRWVGEPTKFLSGRDFVNSLRLRINAFPSRARCSRGRAREKTCRAGCGLVETTNHILQICHRASDKRHQRHNKLAAYVEHRLRNKPGFIVEAEKDYRLGNDKVRPDIVATKDNISYIIHAQVVSDQIDPDIVHRDKKLKYTRADLVEKIKEKFGSTTVKILTITLNWRGVWSPKSATDLLENNFIRKGDLKILSTRTLMGGIIAWNTWNKRTNVRRRTGIG